ncbi:MAG: DUF6273 domain-containing protein, partial [Lachnospiraceae bacterium]|nr:DUF6273 domain-containing protein [Lachnospiraceae bacterium]
MEEKLNLISGDRITFGSYPTEADGTVRPVVWRVLEVKDDKALIITEEAIDAAPYNEQETDVTWETCSIRKYLNADMFDKLFSDSEKQLICETEHANPDNDHYKVSGGNNTKDRLFLLSTPEAEAYFVPDTERLCAATSYAEMRGASPYCGNCIWWLRSPGEDARSAAFVIVSVDVRGGRIDAAGGVRPACTINVSDPEVIKSLLSGGN